MKASRQRGCIALNLVTIVLFSHIAYAIPPILGVIRSDTTFTNFGAPIVHLGDQNGDGYADFLAWDLRQSAYFFRGGNPLDTHVVARIDSVGKFISDVGDLTEDGYADLMAGALASYKYKLRLFPLGPSFDSVPTMIFGLDSLPSRGYDAHGHDLNANGTDDFVAWTLQSTRVLLFELGGSIDSIPDLVFRPTVLGLPEYTLFGWGIATGRFNNDSYWDLAISVNPDPAAHINGKICFFWGGPSFDTIPDLVISHPGLYKNGNEDFGKNLVNLGDVNGDGFDDLIAGPSSSFDTIQYVYFGGPALNAIPNVVIEDQVQVLKSAGDINGDGYKDLITSRPVPSSGFGYTKIYFGGSAMDNIPDITINVGDMPEYLTYLGQDAVGVGDVNGDSVCDFAVSAIDNLNRGVIYVFAGVKSPVDVDEEFDKSLPSNLSLHQNYPNPFNPSTTIEFEIVKPARAVVRVYNALGEVVRTLVDRQLMVGTHREVWDGRDDQGREVASGVYLYRLTAGGVTQEKKMVLVR